jgi:asparagine synthase (glutamine-hydrolysing)
MCGIGGIYNYNLDKKISLEMLESISTAISHRGPDDNGAYLSENSNFGLVHRRLAIIDPSPKASQPFTMNKDALSYNGVLYNLDYLKEFLKGYHFESHSDTEVLFKLFKQYGVDILSLVEGMFSFGFWDNEHEALYLVRDSVGIKPLYYYDDGERIVFSSEIKGILTQSNIEKSLDPASIEQYLSFGYIQTPSTAFMKIKQLEAGHYLKIDNNGVIRKEFSALEHRPQHIDDPLHEFKTVLNSSIKSHLISDIPITSFLSGGIDSTSMAIELNKIDKGYSYTNFSFKNMDFDESLRAKAIAQHLDVELNVTSRNDQIGIDQLKNIAYFADDLIADPSLIPTFFLSEGTSKNYKVALSADGGDELYHGYHTHTASKIARLIPKTLVPLIRFILNSISKVIPNLGDQYPVRELIQRFSTYLDLKNNLRHLSWRRFITNETKNKIYGSNLRQFVNNDHFQHLPNECSLSELEIKSYLEGNLLKKLDRMSMAHGLEVRVPLLSKDFMSFSLGLNQNHKLKRLKGKVLPKRYLNQELQEKINFDKKNGFSADLVNILNLDLLKQFLKESPKEHLLFQYIDYNYFIEITKSSKSIKENRYLIYAVLNLKFWLDHFVLAA